MLSKDIENAATSKGVQPLHDKNNKRKPMTDLCRMTKRSEVISDLDDGVLTFCEMADKYGIGKSTIDRIARDAAERGLLTREPSTQRPALRALWRKAHGLPVDERAPRSLWDTARRLGAHRWVDLPDDKWSKIKRDRGPARKEHAPTRVRKAATLHRHRSAHARRTARYRGIAPTERKQIIEARNRQILIAYRQGKRTGDIARDLGLTPGAVSNILREMDPTRGRRRYRKNVGKKKAEVDKLDAKTRAEKKRRRRRRSEK